MAELSIHVVDETVSSTGAQSLARGYTEGNPGILEIRERAGASSEEIVTAEALRAAFGPEPMQIPFQEIVFLAKKSSAEKNA